MMRKSPVAATAVWNQFCDKAHAQAKRESRRGIAGCGTWEVRIGRMLNALTLIFCCQLTGELVAKAAALPIPGPVCGMALMFAGLMLRGGIPDDLAKVGDALLGNLSLLFVPAGVGIMLHFGLMQAEIVPISVALIGSTLITIAVTATLMQWLNRDPALSEKSDGDRK
jgi:holin-like protein